jgi:hypothetical protein
MEVAGVIWRGFGLPFFDWLFAIKRFPQEFQFIYLVTEDCYNCLITAQNVLLNQERGMTTGFAESRIWAILCRAELFYLAKHNSKRVPFYVYRLFLPALSFKRITGPVDG